MVGKTAETPFSTPLIFTSTMVSHSSVCRFFTYDSGMSPALFTKTSIEPKVSFASFCRCCQSFLLVTSPATTIALPPSFSILDFSSWSLSSRLAVSTTFAPSFESLRAVASPIPLDAPVMITVLFFISIVFYFT